MLKSEAVVIHMQQSFNDISCLFPDKLSIERLKGQAGTTIFDEEGIRFLNELSRELVSDQRTRNYPDVATFAFFCRKANIVQIKEKYVTDDIIRLGRGIVFHIAPSNVPVNFAYSFICGILTGNVNIVRVPSKNFEQITIIIDSIKRLSERDEHRTISERMAFVRYDRNSSATGLFSALCDVRVIWGGDETISQIRKSPLPARSFDVTFADRYSICVINAGEYLKEENPAKVAVNFYNDTYLFDQNACTAPHLVAWLGTKEEVDLVKSIFWDELYKVMIHKYGQVQPVIAVDKLTALYNIAANAEGVQKIQSIDNLLWRIEIDNLKSDIDDFRCSSGYFIEYHAQSLSELSQIINRKYQTIAYYGFAGVELNHFVQTEKLTGVDRIVPIGQTTDFSVIWDGYDLIRTLSRCLQIV